MSKKISITSLLLIVGFIAVAAVVVVPEIASAGVGTSISSGLQDAANKSGYDAGGDLPTFIGRVIAALLGVVGMIFLVITVYAGLMYMTASGDETKVKKAKSMLATSIIGLLIVIGAYVFTEFVITEIGSAADAT